MSNRLFKKVSTKYYKRRLWKVSSVQSIKDNDGHDKGFRFIKHYEKRSAIGEEWEVVRHSIYYHPTSLI